MSLKAALRDHLSPSRRVLLTSLAATALLPVLPLRAAAPAGLSANQRALHLLSRTAYGPCPGDLPRVMSLGPERYLAEQLQPERLALPPALAQKLAGLATLRMSPIELFEVYGPPRPVGGQKPDPEVAKARRQRARIIMDESAAARFWRAIESPRQLQEVMVDFWFNHFNIFAPKGLDHLWTGSFEQAAIRPHTLGRFRDLLGATAKHPAMLFYLDNWQNTAPGSPGARGKEDGINENYAREVMELHTLGVDGGYSQQDVIALARILTGWGLPPRNPRRRLFAARPDASGFFFDAERHDAGDKVFLGRTIRGSGMDEGEQALDILAHHPATARHLSFQLAQYFVADQPDPALVALMAKRFQETDGNIAEVLRVLFTSAQFWSPSVYRAKFKTPYEYVVSAARLTGVAVVNYRPLWAAAAQQGMPIYGYQTPDGYKNTQDAWLNPDAMTKRLSFATALGSGRLPIDHAPAPRQEDLVAGAPNLLPVDNDEAPQARPLDAQSLIDTLGGEVSGKTRSAVNAARPPLQAAMVLGGPEFMYR